MSEAGAGVWVNDVHSALNSCRVSHLHGPRSTAEVQQLVFDAAGAGTQVSVCGARHAMGGQQFGEKTWLLDMRELCEARQFCQETGLLTIDAGMEWPQVIWWSHELQGGGRPPWGIRQKQTGADELTIGGALAANIHGRGLALPPFVSDVEAFTLVGPGGEVYQCSRTENPHLFRQAIGGYGLFGVVTEVVLRLAPRQRLQRRVSLMSITDFHAALMEWMAAGALYGDLQYQIDERSTDFLRWGVASIYYGVEDGAEKAEPPLELGDDDWQRLINLAHRDRARGFAEYARYYLSTHGQYYWSDTHQLSRYWPGYHTSLDVERGAVCRHSEMITEVYVPTPTLAEFMAAAAAYLRTQSCPVIYGTVRLIEKDTETVLAWAREPWACIIFNLCVEHSSMGLAAAKRAFGWLIDAAADFGGSYFPTYHRWVSRAQVERCHPRMVEFLSAKQAWDPAERFTSEWYRYHAQLF